MIRDPGKLIKKYVTRFEDSDFREQMKLGEAYYRHKNVEIMKRSKKFMSDHGPMSDPYKANNKMPSSYLKLLVKQKVNYSINEGTMIDSDQEDRIKEDLGNWKKYLKETGKEASKKAVGWCLPYIEDGKFKLKKIPSEQVVWIPPADDEEGIEYVIRYYDETVTDASGKTVNLKRAEVWDSIQVYYYSKTAKDNKAWEMDKYKPYNPMPHITRTIKYGKEVRGREEQGWGKPPFIRLWNDDEHQTDLEPIKAFIDAYDIVSSDFANNLEDFQDVYWILKNYGGEPVEEVLKQIKHYKVLATPEEGDARTETINIPTEARKVLLDVSEKLIYKFGMGLNPDDIEGNITNVRIEALFANLDLKANDFEDELQEFWDQLMYFLNRYYQLTGQPPAESSLKFKRTRIINKESMLTANAGQMGMISERTRLKNHPYVNDVEEELELMSQESQGIVIEDNPIPAPRPEETLEDYGERVVDILISEGRSEEEAIAIIQQTYDRYRS